MSVEALLGEPVVDAGLAVGLALHPAPDPGAHEPFHQLGTADAERILEILVRPGAEAVEG